MILTQKDLWDDYIVSDFDGCLVDNITPLIRRGMEKYPEFRKFAEEQNLVDSWITVESYYEAIGSFDGRDKVHPNLWEDYCSDEHYYDDLVPNENVYELVSEAHRKGRLHICTRHIYSPGTLTIAPSVKSKQRFLNKWFPNATYNIVSPVMEKYKTLTGMNFKDGTDCECFTAFIEDNEKEMLSMKKFVDNSDLEKNRKYILVDYGYNRHLDNTFMRIDR